MSLAQGLQRAVTGVLGTLGTDVILSRRITGSYDRTLHAPNNTLVEYRVKGAWEEIHAREVDGTTVEMGDRRLTISGSLTFVPTTEDEVCDVFGQRYRIIHVRRHEVADGTAAYTLQVRGNP